MKRSSQSSTSARNETVYVPGEFVRCDATAWGIRDDADDCKAFMMLSPKPSNNAQSRYFRTSSLIMVVGVSDVVWFGAKQTLLCLSSDGVVGWMLDNWVRRT